MIARIGITRLATIAGSFAVGALCAAIYHERTKKTAKRHHKVQVSTWEGEGGAVHGVPIPSSSTFTSQ